MRNRSAWIAVANYASALIVYAALNAREHLPRAVEYLLYPFFTYFALSLLFALGGVIAGARDYSSTDNKLFELAGIAGNAVYFVGFVLMLKSIWPVLMGV